MENNKPKEIRALQMDCVISVVLQTNEDWDQTAKMIEEAIKKIHPNYFEYKIKCNVYKLEEEE